MNKTIRVTQYNNLLTFRDSDKKLESEGEVMKRMTNKKYNVDLPKFRDKKEMFGIAKEMYFDENAISVESTTDKFLIGLLESPAIMAGSLKKNSFSKPMDTKSRFLSSNPYEFCDRT